MPSQSIDPSSPNPATRITGVYNICGGLVGAAEPEADANTVAWHSWFYTYLMWHEGSQLTTRTQKNDGPARGLMQLEATTAWDTIKIYVMGPTAGLVARLADAAGVGADTEMKPTLKAFGKLANPANEWPDASPANKVEQWLLSSDSLGICLMQIFFERFDTTLPPLPPVLATEDARNPQYHSQFASVWADSWWKGPSAQRAARIQQFLASAAALDAAMAQVGAPPSGNV